MYDLDEIKKNKTQFDNVYRYNNKLFYIVKRNGKDVIIEADSVPELRKTLARYGYPLFQREHNIIIPEDVSHEGYFAQTGASYEFETGGVSVSHGSDTSQRARKLRKKLNR